MRILSHLLIISTPPPYPPAAIAVYGGGGAEADLCVPVSGPLTQHGFLVCPCPRGPGCVPASVTFPLVLFPSLTPECLLVSLDRVNPI